MWIARDKDGDLWLFTTQPQRGSVSWFCESNTYQASLPSDMYIEVKWEDEPIDMALVNRKRFWDIIMEEREAAAKLARNTWQGWAEGRVAKLQKRISALDRKIGKLLNSHKNTNEVKEIETTITLTKYYENYDEAHEWFINMLKKQVGGRYEGYTAEQLEEVWADHIKEEYTFDEIWDTVQCDGYTKIILRMGRHDNQPDYDYVCETKGYIDNILKKHGY